MLARLLLIAFLLQSCYNTTSIAPYPQDVSKKQASLKSTSNQGNSRQAEKAIQALTTLNKISSQNLLTLSSIAPVEKESTSYALGMNSYETSDYQPATKKTSPRKPIKLFKQQEHIKNPELASRQSKCSHDTMRLLADQHCTGPLGQVILFKELVEGLQATVKEIIPGGFNREYVLPVVVDPRLSFSQADIANSFWQKRYVHIFKSHIYVGQLGLLGGMIRDEEDDPLENLPNECFCPITQEIMEEPVIIADGHTYEKSAIKQWFDRGHRTSPKTGARILHTELTPNYAMRSLIADLKSSIPALARHELNIANIEAAIKLREEELEQTLSLKGNLLKQEQEKVAQLEKQLADMRAKTASLSLARHSNEATEDAKQGLPTNSIGIVMPNHQPVVGTKKWTKQEIDQLVTQAKAGNIRAFTKILTTAQGNDAYVQYTLGMMYKNGWGVYQDYQKAVEWYQKAAEQGHASAQFNIGVMYKNGSGVIKNVEKAVEWYLKAAKQGDASAQCNLGVMYKNGSGVIQDDIKAIVWYLKAAKQGDASAQNNLGLMYDNGSGVIKDAEKAVEWYQKAAEQGYASAQCNLGVMYKNGSGVIKNVEKAVEWYLKAAEQGYASAQNNLGWMYQNGSGVIKNVEKAVEWYLKAAEQGHASAQFNLGVMYDNGSGVIKNVEKAVEWYLKAAKQGYAAAQFNLGVKYQNGSGVIKNVEKAVEWYLKAAEQGQADAQGALNKLKRYC